MTRSGLEKINEAKKNGLWDSAYTSLIRDRLPSDLKKSLMENKVALNNFKNFANTYRNMYIGWVKGAKNKEIRKSRISEVVKRATNNKKPGFE